MVLSCCLIDEAKLRSAELLVRVVVVGLVRGKRRGINTL